MPLPQGLRDDDIERLAQRLRFHEAEDSLGAGIPKANDPLGIGIDDGIRRGAKQGRSEAINVEVRTHAAGSRLSKEDNFRLGRIRSASVVLSSTARNAASASPSTPCRTQPGWMTQASPAPKQGATAKSGSVRRRTTPMLIVSGGRPSRRPPRCPRTVAISPASAA